MQDRNNKNIEIKKISNIFTVKKVQYENLSLIEYAAYEKDNGLNDNLVRLGDSCNKCDEHLAYNVITNAYPEAKYGVR